MYYHSAGMHICGPYAYISCEDEKKALHYWEQKLKKGMNDYASTEN